MILVLRSAIYPVSDLVAAKAWYSKVLDATPYFDEPFYVGFNVGGAAGAIKTAVGPPPLSPGP